MIERDLSRLDQPVQVPPFDTLFVPKMVVGAVREALRAFGLTRRNAIQPAVPLGDGRRDHNGGGRCAAVCTHPASVNICL
jgi:hypothetical protein